MQNLDNWGYLNLMVHVLLDLVQGCNVNIWQAWCNLGCRPGWFFLHGNVFSSTMVAGWLLRERYKHASYHFSYLFVEDSAKFYCTIYVRGRSV